MEICSSKIKDRHNVGSSNSIPGFISKGNEIGMLKKYVHSCIYCKFIRLLGFRSRMSPLSVTCSEVVFWESDWIMGVPYSGEDLTTEEFIGKCAVGRQGLAERCVTSHVPLEIRSPSLVFPSLSASWLCRSEQLFHHALSLWYFCLGAGQPQTEFPELRAKLMKSLFL